MIALAALALFPAGPPIQPPPWQERIYKVAVSVVATPMGNSNPMKVWLPLPAAWPEQTVETVSKKTQRCQTEKLKLGGNELLQVSVAALRNGQTASCEVVLRVVAQPIRRAWKPGDLAAAPAKPPAKLAEWTRPGPGIEAADRGLVAQAAAAVGAATSPEDQARALMAFVKGHMKHVEGPFTSAKQALATGKGDCEERSALFVALCRARGLPARTVQTPGPTLDAPGHVWAEVWLPTAAGDGIWAPVDPGAGWFGELPVAQLVLQKGDAFKIPGLPGPAVRYLSPRARGTEPAPELAFDLAVTTEDGTPIVPPAAPAAR